VTFLASVNYTGNTSLEIGIAEDIHTQVARHANRCYFTMVAMDEAGKPTPVPPFKPSTPNEHRRFEEAKLRKALRHELTARHQALKHPHPS
jgi:acyl-CoA hydrolase